MHTAPNGGRRAGRNQKMRNVLFSKPDAPENQAKCKRCQPAFNCWRDPAYSSRDFASSARFGARAVH